MRNLAHGSCNFFTTIWPKDEALRKAKLSYIETAQGRMAAPQYWAGLVLIGNTSSTDLSDSVDWWWHVLAGVVAVIILILTLGNKK